MLRILMLVADRIHLAVIIDLVMRGNARPSGSKGKTERERIKKVVALRYSLEVRGI